MITKIISGGQTGADQAGLYAAKHFGISTGGNMPLDCITLNGPRVEFLDEFNMVECQRKGYPARTEKNVMDSDGTLRFATNFKSAGEKCTLRFIKWHKKPYFDINPNSPPSVEEVVEWIESNNIKVLNIAGNSETTSEGIFKFTYEYLTELFNAMQLANRK